MIVQVCVGSSCHLKGSEEIIRLFTENLQKHQLEDEVILAGSFCIGKCDRNGVTIQVDDEIYTGVTPENFGDFFKKNILEAVEKERK